MAFVQHCAVLAVGPRNIDVQIELTFFELRSMAEKRRMDGDHDGTVTTAEVDEYAAAAVPSIAESVRLSVAGRAVELVPLYTPEIDLLGVNRIAPSHHVFRVFLFARTPEGLAPGDELILDDGLWAQAPAICMKRAEGRDGVRVQTDLQGGAGGAESDRRLRVRCEDVPDRATVAPESGLPGATTSPEGNAGAFAKRLTVPGAVLGFAMLVLAGFTGRRLRMKRALGSVFVLYAAIAFSGRNALGAAETRDVLGAAAELAGRIARNHPYLLDASQRTAFDDINRRLREAQQAAQKGQAAATQAAPAMADLAALLEKCPNVVRVSLAGGKASLSPPGPFTLPGDGGGMLIRIDGEPGGESFSTSRLNLAELPDEAHTVRIRMRSAGVTWAVVTVEQLPAGRTSLILEFEQAGRPTIPVAADFNTTPRGRIRLNILSDETGKPVPAMVRMVWKVDGMDRQPANGIEFAPQFDMQGMATGRRASNYPGQAGEYYWCAPEPVDMAVPPGDWEVIVRRGVEHIPIRDSFAVGPGQRVEKTYTCRRWVDMRNLGWYSGDDHVHCRIQSDADAERLMAWVRAEDIHVANVVQMGDIHRTFFQQRGWGKDYRVVRDDYVLSPGQECPRTHSQIGHTLAMNTTGMVRDTDKYYLYDWVFDAVHGQGGLSGYAHVCSKIFYVHRDMSLNIPKGKVDFVELLQFGRLGTELYYDFLNTGFKITASAGSDVPWGGTVGEVRLYAYIGEKPFSADAWFEAVRRGRTFVTNGPMIEFSVDGALPGDELAVRENRKLRVRARAWGDSQRLMPVKLEIVRHGEVIMSRAGTAGDPGGRELSVDFTVDAGHGFWLAARAEGSDGSTAHTTPVYVAREGLRFWKFAAANELITRRLASLKEIEELVADAKARDARGEVEGDLATKMLARQGEELLMRVQAANALYRQLAELIEKERLVREAAK